MHSPTQPLADLAEVFIEPSDTPPSDARVLQLVREHRRFLDFLEHRLGDRALAEDVLQAAFVRSLDRLPASEGESLVAWFYRVLKNAVIDQHRRQSARTRALERFASELDEPTVTAEVEAEACRCVLALADHLRPEYRDALRRIELDGLAVKDFALEAGITSQNAAVRVLRARRALERELARACGTCATHGCFDCSCGSPPHARPK
jgi:RNA polymerase sigma factor (sigma-70 family)